MSNNQHFQVNSKPSGQTAAAPATALDPADKQTNQSESIPPAIEGSSVLLPAPKQLGGSMETLALPIRSVEPNETQATSGGAVEAQAVRPDLGKQRELIGKLDSPDYRVRQEATRQLMQSGLDRALAAEYLSSASLQTVRTLSELIDRQQFDKVAEVFAKVGDEQRAKGLSTYRQELIEARVNERQLRPLPADSSKYERAAQLYQQVDYVGLMRKIESGLGSGVDNRTVLDTIVSKEELSRRELVRSDLVETTQALRSAIWTASAYPDSSYSAGVLQSLERVDWSQKAPGTAHHFVAMVARGIEVQTTESGALRHSGATALSDAEVLVGVVKSARISLYLMDNPERGRELNNTCSSNIIDALTTQNQAFLSAVASGAEPSSELVRTARAVDINSSLLNLLSYSKSEFYDEVKAPITKSALESWEQAIQTGDVQGLERVLRANQDILNLSRDGTTEYSNGLFDTLFVEKVARNLKITVEDQQRWLSAMRGAERGVELYGLRANSRLREAGREFLGVVQERVEQAFNTGELARLEELAKQTDLVESYPQFLVSFAEGANSMSANPRLQEAAIAFLGRSPVGMEKQLVEMFQKRDPEVVSLLARFSAGGIPNAQTLGSVDFGLERIAKDIHRAYDPQDSLRAKHLKVRMIDALLSQDGIAFNKAIEEGIDFFDAIDRKYPVGGSK